MKKYQNKRHGFEILIPTNWVPTNIPEINAPFGETILLYHSLNEALNMIIGIEVPELDMEQTEEHFNKFAKRRGYSIIDTGRINAGEKSHFCASYVQPNDIWTKKYMVVFDETEYAITATCPSKELFLEYEEKWDLIVETFKIIPHEKPTPVNEREKVLNAGIYFEHGHSLYNAGKYEEAIEQFEKGKVLANYLPGNYFGITLTILEMIEKGLIPNNQIKQELIRAESNVKECLRIFPNEKDYLNIYKLIVEKKKDIEP